jgi:DNA gyrase subunit A
MMFTLKGQAVRSPIKDVRITGRAASGVKLVNLGKKDELIGISKVIASEKDENEEEDAGETAEAADAAETES